MMLKTTAAVALSVGAAIAAARTASADPAITSATFDPTNFSASADGMTTAASGIGVGDIGAAAAAAGAPSVDPAAAELPPFDWNNFAISVFGIPLFQVGTASALTLNDHASIAIADGANASAGAGLGWLGPAPPAFDFALAYGDNAYAGAFGAFASATAFGNNSQAASDGFLSSATVVGPNADAQAGFSPADFFDSASIHNTGSGFDQSVAGGGNLDIASVVRGNDELLGQRRPGDAVQADISS